MVIVDSQVHIWAADTPDRPWPPGRAAQAHRAEPFGRNDLLREMDAAGVARVVIVPPSWEGDRNDLALDAAQRHPERCAVMGRLPVERPESRPLIADWKRQPGMLGLRFTFHTALQRPWLTDGTAEWVWPAAEQAGIPIMVFVPGSLREIGAIAERHAGLRLVIDHLALPLDRKDDRAFDDLPLLLALARLPNVAVKASALPCYSSQGYPYRNLHSHVRRVYDAFGPRRMFWGTDLTRLPCSYRQAITLFTEELGWLSETDKEWIMGRAVSEWLGWSPG
jgi:predicted TIM-barrel fold metal-dependent hydrolase